MIFPRCLFLLILGLTCLVPGTPLMAFDTAALNEMDAQINGAIAAGKIPGAVVWLEAKGEVYTKAYGYRALAPRREKMTTDTVFDLASLTKVLATTPAILRLIESGTLDLHDVVQSLLPEFQGLGKDAITIRDLLTHVSGLPAGIPVAERPSSYTAGLEWIYSCELKADRGLAMIYSDLNYILLGEIFRQTTGEDLATATHRELWAPLRMWSTWHRPPSRLHARIAPTEEVDGRILRGVVHDPTCRLMGGVTGNAGLFGSARDVARFDRMLLDGGLSDGVRVLEPETIAEMAKSQTPDSLGQKRGLGWDIDSSLSEKPRGAQFTPGESFGHTGWTGTSVWIEPAKDLFLILLTNRNHPKGGDVRQLRYEVATLGVLAAAGVSKKPAPQKPVMNGIDVLIQDQFAPLQGLKVGLITNHTGLSRDGQSTIDLLHRAPGVELKALFGPEHGIRGQLDQPEIEDGRDDRTGIPVFSLYGATRKPQPEQLAGLDALVFDIQDIGCRFYTYISTMGLAMEAAAEQGLGFVVLDRVNPIGGTIVDGPVTIPERRFTSHHPIAIQHGMTVGELALMFRDELDLKLDLRVVPVAHWERAQRFDETGLPWVNPSPNMRSLTQALLYPGIGLLEFTDLSVGRGTDTPFEWIGAPYIDGQALATELQALGLPGIRFGPVQFTPEASVFAGEHCQGVSFTITDRDTIRPIDTGLSIAKILTRKHSDYDIEDFDKLLVHSQTLQAVRDQQSLQEIRAGWQEELAKFRKRRAAHLIYD